MNRRKFIKAGGSAVLAFALAGSLSLFGCSSGGSTDAPAADEAADQTAAEPVTIQIFAANSLEKALPEVQALYTEQHPGVTFGDTQFKASGDLVAQLAQSADAADILITASTSTMDKAVENGSIDETTRVDMFKNDLVVCAAEDSGITVADLADLGTDAISSIAIGEPNTVPAGKYAVQSLESAGLCTTETDANGQITVDWDGSVAGKMNAGADKVGTVASYVAEGTCQVGMVYSSDIYRYDGIESIYTIPADMHKNILYPGAVVANSPEAASAAAFLDFCMTDPQAQAIFSEYGFELA